MKVKFKSEELVEIFRLHELFLKDDPNGVRADLEDANLKGADLINADLRYANLRFANLRGANLENAELENAELKGANLSNAELKGANLSNADLRYTNLSNANLDYSCWPLWCGSFEVKVDTRIAVQLAYHFCRLDCDDPEYVEARNAIVPFANKFHRANECGKLEIKE